MATKPKESMVSESNPSVEQAEEKPVKETKAKKAGTRAAKTSQKTQKKTTAKTSTKAKAKAAKSQQLQSQQTQSEQEEAVTGAIADSSQNLTALGTPNSESASSTMSQLNHKVSGADISFLAADHIANSDMWLLDTNIPTLDEATYAAQKAQAEAQRRAIEVASLNLKNINDLHQLEHQSLDVAISAKNNETRAAQLTGADIDYQTQLEVNGEKSQHLRQAAVRREAATRETGYTEQLLALKDQNFELEIQQAQSVFAEKAARYRAQLTD
ncbi:MAG: hypothetical protein ACFB16_11315 [Phormidesmis sp.]